MCFCTPYSHLVIISYMCLSLSLFITFITCQKAPQRIGQAKRHHKEQDRIRWVKLEEVPYLFTFSRNGLEKAGKLEEAPCLSAFSDKHQKIYHFYFILEKFQQPFHALYEMMVCTASYIIIYSICVLWEVVTTKMGEDDF